MKRRARRTQGAARQRGWAGLVLLLIALVIGAFLAKEAARQYGMTRGASTTKSNGAASARTPSVDAAPADASSVRPAAMERARGVEDIIQRQADEQAKRMP